MSEIQMRVAKPDLLVDAQVNSAGLGLINTFCSDLYSFIDKGLTKTDGKDWLVKLQAKDINSGEANYRDPSVLLKELVTKGQTPLRKPISTLVPSSNWKDFYNRLEEILGKRHSWVHNSVKADSDQLKSLVVLINKVAWALELSVVRECTGLLEWISPEESEAPIETESPVTSPPKTISQLNTITTDDETSVGTPILGPFASYSYTLHMDGSIRNRSTDEELDQFIDGAERLGALLIARKPSGGRLRITPEGIIAAYFGDSWGFLAQVHPKGWFPGHLS
jgi:hypothetical protein